MATDFTTLASTLFGKPIFDVASCLGNFPDDTLAFRIFCFIYEVITNRNKLIINKLTSLLVAGALPRMVGPVWVTAQFQYRNVLSLCRVYMEWLRCILL